MTRRPPFTPTHEIVLTDRTRQRPRLILPVLLRDNGWAVTEDEWRTQSKTYPHWSYTGDNWCYQGRIDMLPPGYTTLKVRRVSGRRTAMGPTVLRGGSEVTNATMTYAVTESEREEIRGAAKRAGEKHSAVARREVLAWARRRR